MKTIPNPIFELEIKPGEHSCAASLLEVCISRPPEGGFDFKTMRARNRIADAIDKLQPGIEIKLEDSDYQVAVDAIKAMKWGANHKDLLKFAELFGL